MKTSLQLLSMFLVAFMVAACGSEDKDYTNRMAEEHKEDQPVQNESVLYKQKQPVDTMTVNYAQTDSGVISGFFARPKKIEGNLPGIIVIHEWWGLNDNIRMMTRRLAGLGFNALAVDLYNGNVAQSPDGAKKYMQIALSNTKGAMDNLKQAYSYLAEQQGSEKIGVIGWCFGGAWSLETALAMPDKIDAAVVYYGRLVTDTNRLRTLNMPILGFFGGQDQGIPPEQVKKFEAALNEAGVTNAVHIYEGAGHAFANPSGTRYNKQAAQDAWEKTKTFLKEHLKTE